MTDSNERPRPGHRLDRRSFLAGTASFIALHPFSANAQAGQAHLRIMETTDLHVHVFPYNYYSDREDDTVGLARTAAHIADIRAEASNSMLIDNGDFLQGNPMGDYIAYERGMKEGDMHPIIQAMNTLGFDASTLGNHEFNYGLSFLEKSLAGANFPVVSANIAKTMGADPTKDETLLKPYVLLDRVVTDGDGVEHQIKIGIIHHRQGVLRSHFHLHLGQVLDGGGGDTLAHRNRPGKGNGVHFGAFDQALPDRAA